MKAKNLLNDIKFLFLVVGVIILFFACLIFFASSKSGVKYPDNSNGPTMAPLAHIGVFEISSKTAVGDLSCIYKWGLIEVTIVPKIYTVEGELEAVFPEEYYKFYWGDLLESIEDGTYFRWHKFRWDNYGGYDITIFTIGDYNIEGGWICIKTEDQRVPDIPFQKNE